MVETLFEKAAPWLAGDAPDAEVAVWCQCNLLRNLSDFPFPAACSEEEKRSVEERVTGALESRGLLGAGQYCGMSNLSRTEAFFLAERRLIPWFIPFDFARARTHAGVYVAEDQCLSITVNGPDHLCITTLASGLQLQEAWTRSNLVDDTLARALDYAFDKRFGHLTTSLGHLGTGLSANVVLHLPCLTMTNGLSGLVQAARQRRQSIHGLKATTIASPAPGLPIAKGKLAASRGEHARATTPEEHHVREGLYCDPSGAPHGDVTEAQGDLYVLTNLSTLGAPEEELLFHLRHTAGDAFAEERATRKTLMAKERRHLEDRVMRALGIARTARLIGFSEAMSLLSSLRLGLELGVLSGFTRRTLNELLFTVQSAHMLMRAGRDCDEWTLSIERADLFRARFSPDREG